MANGLPEEIRKRSQTGLVPLAILLRAGTLPNRTRGQRMIVNAPEAFLVNNPARALVQQFYEGPLLLKLGGRLDGARVLEAGCGRGTGVRILLEQFGAGQVYAIDLDPRQVRRAKRRLSGYSGERVVLSVGSVESLPFPDECFDAVFDFGMLHHVPVWQAAVAEIRRVLKPSGKR